MEEIRNLISEGKTVTITVKGNSMNPFMAHLRDQMTLGPWKEEDIRKGTVALVLDTNGNHLIHRIIKVEKDKYTMQGDGNPTYMKEVFCEADIIGIADAFIRKGKTVTTQSTTWRAYSAAWRILKPFRRILLAVYRRTR